MQGKTFVKTFFINSSRSYILVSNNDGDGFTVWQLTIYCCSGSRSSWLSKSGFSETSNSIFHIISYTTAIVFETTVQVLANTC